MLALATGGVGCGSDDDVSDEEVFGGTSTTRLSSSAVEGRFDVGKHKLYLRCTGKGSPTVVYLHSAVLQPGDPGLERAGEVPSLLDDRYRVCVYDRANVGRSDDVPGRLTGMDSVRDLHALLGSAGLKGPFVLLGSTLGGAIADLYAARYPHDVAGMVLLATTLPANLETQAGGQPGGWRTETEHLDRPATYRQVGRIQGQRRKIPVTYMAAAARAQPGVEATRTAQTAFVSRFSPGRLAVVTGVRVPHDMAAEIPVPVAREVKRVIAAAKRR